MEHVRSACGESTAQYLPQATNATSCVQFSPIQAGARDWQEQISIVARENEIGETTNSNVTSRRTSILSDELCYSCKTTLTSRSPRFLHRQGPVTFPLPTWSSEAFKAKQRLESMSRDDMKSVIGEYLLD